MDPDVCLQRIKDAWTAKDAQALRDARADMQNWLSMGGFAPSDPDWQLWMTRRRDRPWKGAGE
jgi:hypothetical protein